MIANDNFVYFLKHIFICGAVNLTITPDCSLEAPPIVFELLIVYLESAPPPRSTSITRLLLEILKDGFTNNDCTSV
jgi:hypothetical protein